jgi:predicted acylesterase/phospholipase RssA
MKHLGMSGGGTKIPGIFGAAESILMKGYEPTHISGISAGSILSVPIAMMRYHPEIGEQIREIVLNLKYSDFFDKVPVNPDGSIKFGAVLRFLWKTKFGFGGGQPIALGSQENLKKTLSKIIKPWMYEQYKRNDKYPVCMIMAVDFLTGKRKWFNLKSLDYDTYLNAVNASSSIPIFTPGVKMDGMHLFDGGVRDHLISAETIRRFQHLIQNDSKSISIYSRPEDFKIVRNRKMFDIGHVLETNLDIMMTEISKDDEYEENTVCSMKGVHLQKIFLPRIASGFYDIKKDTLRMLYASGRLKGSKVKI